MLYQHQLDIIRDDPKKTGLFLGTGSGKTLIALSLARGKTLVICPKTQKEDRNWERENEKNKLGVDLTVISKETFRRDWESLGKFDTVIVEECHTCLGVTPNTRQRKKIIIPKTSQLFEALDNYIKKHKPERIYLVTATIIKNPFTVWGAAKILGKEWDFYQFRSTYYIRLPIPSREVWTAKNDSATKDRLARTVRGLGYTGKLSEYFDVPEQTYRTIFVDLTGKQKLRLKTIALDYPDPLVLLGKKHQIEQGVLAGDEFNMPERYSNEKTDKIIELAEEFPRMVVFAKYRAQIDDIGAALAKEGKNVLFLTGDTKDRGKVIAEANAMKECIFIAQAQVSAGWELPQYEVMVFASLDWSIVNYVQAQGRILRANALKKNLYIHLVVKDGVDEAVFDAIMNKQDFISRIYLNI